MSKHLVNTKFQMAIRWSLISKLFSTNPLSWGIKLFSGSEWMTDCIVHTNCILSSVRLSSAAIKPNASDKIGKLIHVWSTKRWLAVTGIPSHRPLSLQCKRRCEIWTNGWCERHCTCLSASGSPSPLLTCVSHRDLNCVEWALIGKRLETEQNTNIGM